MVLPRILFSPLYFFRLACVGVEKNLLPVLVFIALPIALRAQPKLPVIWATSTQVAINDGGYLDKNAWTLSPQARPDVYVAGRSRKPKWVTFYTDVDSIRTRVEPGSHFDFVILLNGKDSCFTRIDGDVPAVSATALRPGIADTLSFQLTDHEAIQVKALVNETDTLNLHFDLGTLRFRLTKDGLRKTRGWPAQGASSPGGPGPERQALDKIETLRLGHYVWKKPEVRLGQLAAHNTDGRFGWQVFDGMVVEVDFDHRWLIVHPALPARVKGYTRSEIRFIQSLFCIEASLVAGNHTYKGNFLLDTGSDLALALDSGWMAKQHFPTTLPLLKKSSFKDGAGRTYETRLVSVPELLMGNTRMKSVPASLLAGQSPVGFDVNYLGNAVLKRFNMIIDLTTDHIYLKTNTLVDMPFKAP